MNESNFIETIDKTNLTEQTKIRLNKISEIENYFHQEINQRKSCSKKLSKYVAAFDYIDKVLIALSAIKKIALKAKSGVSIILFTSFVGAPVRIASAIFMLRFCLATGIVKKLLSITRKKRKSMIKFLCWLKVNLIAMKH